MLSKSNKRTNQNENDENDEIISGQINLGGFPPILFLGQNNKKIKEFGKLSNDEQNLKNISKLNILNIKNILGV
jgi:hypothetical protein